MRKTAQDRILQAEKFKASIEAPKGNAIQPFYVSIENEDDKFLHVTCHIDESIKLKIKKCEYVELEKLLPKQHMCGYGEENRVGVFNKEGETYFAPLPEKKGKIWNVGQWDKAFRVFTAIYTEEHPQRTIELMQYVQCIHHAATKYKWDNVAYYDFVFRHLMEQFPHRSWAKTYTQGWTYAMCEPLALTQANNSGGQRKDKRSNTCWRFNKGITCEYGPRCRYPHRCTYCGGTSHGSYMCNKKQRKSEREREDRSERSDRGHSSRGSHSNNNKHDGSRQAGDKKKHEEE